MREGVVPKVLLILSLVAVSIITLINCKRDDSGKNNRNKNTSPAEVAEYVGRENCKECHEKEFNLFQGSDHDMAMDTAISETVLGNFNNISYTHFGITSRFFMEDGNYMVNTEGPDGTMVDYPIAYVFGVRPLQQYLIEFPGGRLQCLPIC